MAAPTTEAGSSGAAGQTHECPIGCRSTSRALYRLGMYRVLRCEQCGLFFLDSTDSPADTQLDRSEFEDAFYSLRLANYDQILDALDPLAAGKRLLDVGCSSGWFLQRALARGYDCHGIEPDGFFQQRARAALPAEVELVQGHFDADVPESWRDFDVITFHDVFEHVPDPRAVLAACRRRLNDRGLLVLSLPSAGGFVFRLGSWLQRLGSAGALERMFQVHYPYPHLFYFDDRSIAVMAARSGFRVVSSFGLRGFSARGAFHRAQMDRAADVLGRLRNQAAGAALVMFAGLQYLLPADNAVFILQPESL